MCFAMVAVIRKKGVKCSRIRWPHP